ncbi:S8 family peptidase [Paenibacillus humicola]|uniref:S8 family peptidase n=1 Tax=Paenibacillus humicola TaxID=3110540 RepID=UPI00237BB326|nr:S8 family peptidase [Paenibacillus humicola]
MRRRKWIGWFAACAAAVFLIPLMPWFGTGERTAPPARPAPAPKAAVAGSERHLKLQAVQHDMNATETLCKTECSKNFYKLMSSKTAPDRDEKALRRMMAMHKQMKAVWWRQNGRTLTGGKLPSGDNRELKRQLALARGQLAQGRTYASPAIEANGHRYMVIAVPDRKRKGDGIVAVLLQDIVMNVERHQRRNLRVVPYPAEGRYKIESVKSNTLRDTTVDSGEDNGSASHYRVDEVVVKFKGHPSERELERMKREVSANSVRKLGYTYVFQSDKMEAEPMIRYFQSRWNPSYVEPHYLYLTNDVKPIVPNDALYSEYQWNLPTIETERGWSIGKGSDKVIVATLDTGVQTDHPDLQGKLAEGTNLVSPGNPPEDDVGHGTHVAGIIAAVVNNNEGVAGLSWYNKVLPVKVLDDSGAGSTYTVAEGIIWATDHGAKVINMSLGNYAQAQFLHDAIKYAYDRDVVLVAASGNDNTERPGYPAAYPEVFAVASTDANGNKSSFSNYGDYIDVAAPGDSIASTYPGSQYAALSGTSMASPHVAALAGLIRSINPSLSNEQVYDIMRRSSLDLGDEGKDKYFGYGQIDIVRALEMASPSNESIEQYPQQVESRLQRIMRKYEAMVGKG